MGINIQNSTQYQGVIEVAGNPQNSTVEVSQVYSNFSDVPSNQPVGPVWIGGVEYYNDGTYFYQTSKEINYNTITLNPYEVGLWKLDIGASGNFRYAIKDYSGKRNHLLPVNYGGNCFQSSSSDSDGWFGHTVNATGTTARITGDIFDPAFDLTGPGQHFICHFEFKKAYQSTPARHNETVVVKYGSSAHASRLALQTWDNTVSPYYPRIRININNSSTFSTDLEIDTPYRIAIVRNATTNKIYVYVNGVLDANFTSGLTYNPTVTNPNAVLNFFGEGSGLDNNVAQGVAGYNDQKIRNLRLWIMRPNLSFPSNLSAMLTKLNTNPLAFITAGEMA